jgi:hypothetical protein
LVHAKVQIMSAIMKEGSVSLHVSMRAWWAQVHLDRPQETLMWEAFAQCVRSVKAGGSPEEHWPKITEVTQRVMLAVEESARNDCKPVTL